MSTVLLPSPDEAAAARAAFLGAEPFPHVVLHDVVSAPADEVAGAFPPFEWDGWRRFEDGYQRGKVFCDDIETIPPLLASIIHQLNAPSSLSVLEALTGIEGLIPDPYLEGGGLHGSGPGGVLAAHTDFHVYRRLGLYRMLNLILYLNPDWPADDEGGGLGLYRPGGDRPELVVPPAFGTCVVFRTDDRSPHGFASPVPEGRFRRSIALYYYSSTEAAGYSGGTSTDWREHTEHRGPVARARMAAYRSLSFGSRGFSWLAHRANPDLGGHTKAT